MPTQYEKMAHLLRRAGFGARPDEINQALRQGFVATVEQLLNYETTPENPEIPATPTTRDGTFNIRLLEIENTASWWLDVMIKTRRPLQERMVVFWHDHFATAVSKVGAPNGYKYLYWQNLTFRRLATANFRTLLKAINRDPAMLWWLDNYLNVKDSPNENYARELFEIFVRAVFEAGPVVDDNPLRDWRKDVSLRRKDLFCVFRRSRFCEKHWRTDMSRCRNLLCLQ